MTSPMLTPARVQALGYTPLFTHPKNDRALVPTYKAGCGIDVPAGPQADGTYLYKLDLDQHDATQNAQRELDRITVALGKDTAAKLAIKRSRGGAGFHVLFKTARPFSEEAGVKVYNPHRPTELIGDLIGPGGRVTLTGEWLQGGPDAIPTFSALELDKLRGAIHTPKLYREPMPGTPSAQTRIVNGQTQRKQRMNEGLSLIAGWERIKNAKHTLDRYCAQYPQLAKRRAELHTDPNRSDAYGRFVQSLMLHAWMFGKTTDERCQLAAALAIAEGANGKERERDYKIELDTAVLIARILHGDPFESGAGAWMVPGWANGYTTAPQARPAPTQRTQASTPTRAPGRPAGSRAEAVERVYRVLAAITPDGFGRRVYTLDTLSADLLRRFKHQAAPRTLSSYLAELRTSGRILGNGQISGNGAPWVILKCDFGDADNSQKRVQNDADRAQGWDADAHATHRTAMHQTQTDTRQVNKEEGTPKVSGVPGAAPSAGRGAAPLGVPSGGSAARASGRVVSDAGGASYDPAADFTAKRARRGAKAAKTTTMQRLDASAKLCARWEQLYSNAGGGSCGLSVLQGERNKLRHTARARSGAQAKALTAQANELQRLIDRYQSVALIAFFHPEPVGMAPAQPVCEPSPAPVSHESAEWAKAAGIHPRLFAKWHTAAAAGDLDWIAQRCEDGLDVARVAAAVLAQTPNDHIAMTG